MLSFWSHSIKFDLACPLSDTFRILKIIYIFRITFRYSFQIYFYIHSEEFRYISHSFITISFSTLILLLSYVVRKFRNILEYINTSLIFLPIKKMMLSFVLLRPNIILISFGNLFLI